MQWGLKSTFDVPSCFAGTYQGQWFQGMRHGHGIRQSVPYNQALHYRPKIPKGLESSMSSVHTDHDEDPVMHSRDRKIDRGRGGFVLKSKSSSEGGRRRSLFDRPSGSNLRKTIVKTLKLEKQRSTGDMSASPPLSTSVSPLRNTTGSVRSIASEDSDHSGLTDNTDSNASFVSQDDIHDASVVETYMGEWKGDKRCGYGVSERSDGLKYEGEWYNNKKNGCGVTTYQDGSKDEGKCFYISNEE